jgi:hypothetical protein
MPAALAPKVATLRGWVALSISVSFHFGAGHSAGQTIAFRGLLPTACGPRDLMKNPWLAAKGAKNGPAAEVRPPALA